MHLNNSFYGEGKNSEVHSNCFTDCVNVKKMSAF